MPASQKTTGRAMMTPMLRGLATAVAMAGLLVSARAEPLTGKPLVSALRQGGYVLLMRHASSPEAKPDKAAADPENTNLERQLDEKGRATARAMGEAFKTIGLPVGEVLSSPTYRARETVRLASFGQAQTFAEIGTTAGYKYAVVVHNVLVSPDWKSPLRCS